MPYRVGVGFGITVSTTYHHPFHVARLFSSLDWVTGGPSSDSKIASLQAANAKLRAELSQAQLSKADESQLSSLLQLAGKGGYKKHTNVAAFMSVFPMNAPRFARNIEAALRAMWRHWCSTDP